MHLSATIDSSSLERPLHWQLVNCSSVLHEWSWKYCLLCILLQKPESYLTSITNCFAKSGISVDHLHNWWLGTETYWRSRKWLSYFATSWIVAGGLHDAYQYMTSSLFLLCEYRSPATPPIYHFHFWMWVCLMSVFSYNGDVLHNMVIKLWEICFQFTCMCHAVFAKQCQEVYTSTFEVQQIFKPQHSCWQPETFSL